MKTTLPWYSGLQLLPSYTHDPWFDCSNLTHLHHLHHLSAERDCWMEGTKEDYHWLLEAELQRWVEEERWSETQMVQTPPEHSSAQPHPAASVFLVSWWWGAADWGTGWVQDWWWCSGVKDEELLVDQVSWWDLREEEDPWEVMMVPWQELMQLEALWWVPEVDHPHNNSSNPLLKYIRSVRFFNR